MATSYWDQRATEADDLLALAEERAEREPGTEPARAAAQQAVKAADALARDRGSPVDLRRLARALWRQASAFLVSGDPAAALAPARRCWALTERTLASVGPQDPGWGETIGEAVQRLGVLMPALGAAGPPGEAERAYQACSAAVAGNTAGGPPVRQAQARLAVFYLTSGADGYAAARIEGRWEQVADQAYLDILVGREVAGTLREFAGDGPVETIELATTLRMVSRIETVAGELPRAAATLDEAIALAATVAGRGPSYQAVLQGMRAERDALPPPAPEPQPEPEPGRDQDRPVRTARGRGWRAGRRSRPG
jgi:hypothetical protein